MSYFGPNILWTLIVIIVVIIIIVVLLRLVFAVILLGGIGFDELPHQQVQAILASALRAN